VRLEAVPPQIYSATLAVAGSSDVRQELEITKMDTKQRAVFVGADTLPQP
jgi:hypothetical protein